MATVGAGDNPGAVAVNLVTNKIYVTNYESHTVTVIDGATNTTTTVTAGEGPGAVAVNPVSNRIYVANYMSNNVTVLTEQSVQPIPLTTAITPLPGNAATVSNPTLSYTVTSAYVPTAPSAQKVYYQVDTWTGPWLQATPTSGGGSFTIPPQIGGIHTVYAFAGDGQEATSINTGTGSSPIPGAMTAYTLLIPTTPGPPTNVSATAGNGQATVSFTPPASDGASPITGYTVTSDPPGGVDSDAGTTALTHTMTNLIGGTPYTFTVTATNAVGPGPSSAPSNSVTLPYSLTLTFSGSGGGTVTGSGVRDGAPVSFSTNTGVTQFFDLGTSVNLHAAQGEYSLFTGWTGACSGTSDCALPMTVNRSVAAVFDIDTAHKTLIYGTTKYNPTLLSAYTASFSNDVILAWGTGFSENLVLGKSIAVTIRGGYNRGYTVNNGYTTLQGSLSVKSGALTVERLVIR